MMTQKPQKRGIFSRIGNALSKSSQRLQTGLAAVFSGSANREEALDQLEELLIEADMGVAVAAELRAAVAKIKMDAENPVVAARHALVQQVQTLLAPYEKKLTLHEGLNVIVMMGVNGNGKTTTIGKLAQQWKSQGKSVMLAAADTYRAAAVEQLALWAQRAGCEFVSGEAGSDPASVAFTAVQRAAAESYDVCLIDTAGRLHNQSNLMDELQKIIRVIGKAQVNAPHYIIQVIDATTGQNAVSQVAAFGQKVALSGLIITKLDGTAKGGIVLSLAKKFGLPVFAIGVGEGIEDLQDFSAADFARALMGEEGELSN